MAEGYVTHAEKDGVHVIRYYGRVEYPIAAELQRYMDALLEQHCQRVVFDLTKAYRLDSTHLGLLARMAHRVRSTEGRTLIVSTHPDINVVLTSMGFDRAFDVVTHPPQQRGEERRIDEGRATREQLAQTMLEAHRTLVELSEQGRVRFRDVVTCLEAELNLGP